MTPRTSYPVHGHNQQQSNPIQDQKQHEQECGQAYYAGAYIPSLRPYVVVGALIITAVLVVYFTNRQ